MLPAIRSGDHSCLNPSRKLVLDLSTTEGWKAELTWANVSEFLAQGNYVPKKWRRPGHEPGTSWSRVKSYTTRPSRPLSVTVLAPWGAKMCRNLRSLCRYAEMSISDYVWDFISSSITEISWRYLAVQIRFKCSIRSWNFSLTASTVRTVGSYCINCFYALPYRYGQRGINGISRLPGSAFCVSAVHRCLRKLWHCRLERYGRKWRWDRIPYFFASPVISRLSPRV